MRRLAFFGGSVALVSAFASSRYVSSVSVTAEEDTDKHLEQIVLVFRHGDRTPISDSLGTKFRQSEEEHQFWHSRVPSPEAEEEWAKLHPPVARDGHEEKPIDAQRKPNAMLTTFGAQHMRNVGTKLRARYKDLLLKVDASEVYAKSSNFLRTVQSAQNVLLGLFPPEETGKKVIPIETWRLSEEIMFPNGFVCPRQLQIIAQISKGELKVPIKDETKEFEACTREGYKQLTRELGQVFGIRDGEKVSLSRVSEVLNCRQSHGLPSPEGVTEELMDRVAKYHSWQWAAWYSSKELCRLGIGRLIEAITDKMVSRAHGTSSVKVALYSGHDSTLLPLLCAFQVFDNKWPSYGSYLVLELWSEEGKDAGGKKHFVRFVYNDKPLRLPHVQTTFCPLEDFVHLAKDLVPHDYEMECRAHEAKL